jgi:hypothetical protein
MAVSCKDAHFPKEIILMGSRCSVASPLSTRHVAALLAEGGAEGDHSHTHQAKALVTVMSHRVRVDRYRAAFVACSSGTRLPGSA